MFYFSHVQGEQTYQQLSTYFLVKLSFYCWLYRERILKNVEVTIMLNHKNNDLMSEFLMFDECIKMTL